MSDVRCSLTHHNACNCREAHFARVEAERDRLRAEVARLAAIVEAAAASMAHADAEGGRCIGRGCFVWHKAPDAEHKDGCVHVALRTALAALDGGG